MAIEPFEPDVVRAAELVMEMMMIPGKSGHETEIADYIRARLILAGVPPEQVKFDSAHKRSPLAGQLGNMVVKLPGTMRGPRRMLTAHLDTVPICVGSVPVRRGNIVRSSAPGRGLGADNRAGCAVLLSVLLEILEHGLPHPPLTVCWFVQEEVGLQGARAASRGLWGNPKLAFNWDGGAPTKLTIGATGGFRTEIMVSGIASHAGNAPEKGVSAIAIAGVAIADLHQNGWHGCVQKGTRHGTSNVGIIRGGEATNVVTDEVYVKAEARSHDPKFRKQILSEIESAFRRAAKSVRNVDGKAGRVSITSKLDYESFLLPTDEPCVRVAQAAVRAVGGEPQLAVANGGVDANWMTAHGLPTVSLGCGQKNQHMESETLNIAQFGLACCVGLRLATATEGADG
jgi:tripeptide aminopeptidase